MSSATTESTSTSNTKPWVERYRPKSLKEVSHQAEVVATLQNAVETGRLPHLLLYGPPGSGKTSVALALCRQLWHPSQWNRRVLELNASDERGISVVRDKIKHFASLSVGKSTSTNTSKNFFQAKKSTNDDDNMDLDDPNQKKYPNPPFKIIILDEADTVTPDAQAALRRIIESHSRITRFILICNYVTRIIEPLASRCAKFRFQSLPPTSMKERLLQIASVEHCTIQEDIIDEILVQADGDMRRAVTTLQSVHSLAVGGDTITTESIAEIAGFPPERVVNELWNTLTQKNNNNRYSTFDDMNKAVDDVCAAGYSAQLLLSAFVPKLMTSSVNELSKARISIRIAEAEKNMIEGADEYLQLMTVCGLILSCHQISN